MPAAMRENLSGFQPSGSSSDNPRATGIANRIDGKKAADAAKRANP